MIFLITQLLPPPIILGIFCLEESVLESEEETNIQPIFSPCDFYVCSIIFNGKGKL